jgi:hypothetical protein
MMVNGLAQPYQGVVTDPVTSATFFWRGQKKGVAGIPGPEQKMARKR